MASPSPYEARRSRQREETRRTILEATESLLEREGSDDFSIRQLAERCGYTAPTIYHYFGDKDGLIQELLEERFASLAEAVDGVPRGADPLERVRRYARLFVDFGVHNPSFFRFILSRSSKGRDRTPPSAERVRSLMTAPTRELAEAGRLVVTPEAATQVLWALMHGLTSLLINRPEIEWQPGLIDLAIDRLLAGLVDDEARKGAAA